MAGDNPVMLRNRSRPNKGFKAYGINSFSTFDKMKWRIHVSTVVRTHIESCQIVQIAFFH